MSNRYSVMDIILKKTENSINRRNRKRMIKNFFAFNKNIDLLEVYKKNKEWIENNSVPGKGIRPQFALSDRYKNIAYPEVTGYYIPTLLNWGFREKALDWAKWLISIQHEDGSWYDHGGKDPYTFDTGQILKGLLAVYPIMPEVKEPLIKGADYILSMQEENGNLTTASKEYWYEGVTTELIHLYCLQPLMEMGKIFGEEKYTNAAKKALKYYTTEFREKLLDFHTLSHFYAYMMEALIDLGEEELARQAMDNVAKYQRNDGMIPAYKNVKWTCSTGLFQFAICWYKLGEKIKADKTFDYACSLQTKNGGWLGSYGKNANYLPNAEISWANKYFLDALRLKISTHFANTTDTKMENCNGTYALEDKIRDNDARLISILEELSKNHSGNIKLLDLGCGLGRFIKQIHTKFPEYELYGCDISEEILKKVPDYVNKSCGSLLNSPYNDNSFDAVMTIEALEHTLDIQNAVNEIYRILKKDGRIYIIDKNIEYKGSLEMPPWEQWFNVQELENIMIKAGFKSVSHKSVYKENEMYILWFGQK